MADVSDAVSQQCLPVLFSPESSVQLLFWTSQKMALELAAGLWQDSQERLPDFPPSLSTGVLDA